MAIELTLTGLAGGEPSVPVVGYIVWWSLSGIRVTHPALEEALKTAGFSAYLPSPPSYRKALRRALAAWIRQRTHGTVGAADEDEETLDRWGVRALEQRPQRPPQRATETPSVPQKAREHVTDEGNESVRSNGPTVERSNASTLIRTINQARARFMMFALVAENKELAVLGLSYATALRILLDKREGGMVVTTAERGIIEVASDMIEAMGGEVTAAEAEARQVAQELVPFWHTYRELHLSGDLSRMVRELVCGELIVRPTRRVEEREHAQARPGMAAVSVRSGGGLYFVPAAQKDALERLRALIQQLPTDGRHRPYIVVLPVLDEAQAKGHLARAIYEGFVDEITILQKDLVQLGESEAPSQATVAARLTTYRQIVAKLDTYADLLGMQRENIVQGLEQLRKQALELLMTDTTDTEEEEGTL